MEPPKASPRFRLFAALAALTSFVWLGCASPPKDAPPPQEAPPPSTPDPNAASEWHDVMTDVVGPAYELEMWPETRRPLAEMDLAKVARAARSAATAMQLGHGRLERHDVPGFADMARDAERWFLQLAADAEAGRAAEARAAILAGEEQHCIACHDAVERARRQRR